MGKPFASGHSSGRALVFPDARDDVWVTDRTVERLRGRADSSYPRDADVYEVTVISGSRFVTLEVQYRGAACCPDRRLQGPMVLSSGQRLELYAEMLHGGLETVGVFGTGQACVQQVSRLAAFARGRLLLKIPKPCFRDAEFFRFGLTSWRSTYVPVRRDYYDDALSTGRPDLGAPVVSEPVFLGR